LNLTKEKIKKKIENGEPYVIRQNNPIEGTTTFNDILYGEITVPNFELEDMILLKTDKMIPLVTRTLSPRQPQSHSY